VGGGGRGGREQVGGGAGGGPSTTSSCGMLCLPKRLWEDESTVRCWFDEDDNDDGAGLLNKVGVWELMDVMVTSESVVE
jgi:hypothetical protein